MIHSATVYFIIYCQYADWFWPSKFLEDMLLKTFSTYTKIRKNINKVLVFLSRIQKLLRFHCFVFHCDNVHLQKLICNVPVPLRLAVLSCCLSGGRGGGNWLVITQVCLINIDCPFIFSYPFSFYVNILRNFPTDILQTMEKYPKKFYRYHFLE